MEIQSIINNLEAEWDLEKGFFGKLRMGYLDVDRFGHLKETLRSIDLQTDILMNRRLVSLIWYIPLFMNWQRERFSGDKEALQILDQEINEITSVLENVLGVP